MFFLYRIKPAILILLSLFLCVFSTLSMAQTSPRKDLRLSDNWRFFRGDATGAEKTTFSVPETWETVCLPHTARLESAKTHTNWDYYKGYCWYRKSFTPDSTFKGKKVFFEVEAGMQTTEVWVNGNLKITFLGGYSPFTIDITNDIIVNQSTVIALRLNNAANANFAPGAEERDFFYYAGLYRYVNLHIVDSLHITDAVYANIPASGGVFVTYPTVTNTSATVKVKTHVVNEGLSSKSCELATTLIDSNGSEIQTLKATKTLNASASDTFVQIFTVTNPRLWNPGSPNLYKVRSRLSDNTRLADEVNTTIGIRRIAFSRANGCQINGVRMKSKGMNRHQDYGAIGNAVPVSGHYRDALRMKEAGINFVRLSHYIQHPSFLDACDKLGITVQACMPGWQYNGFANANFVSNSVRDLRTMIRYYRNHPCVIMWESVHNESAPPASFATLTQAAAHEEFPGDQMFTCGQESANIMDIYQAAVQQGGRTYTTTKPQAISEYGHWEWGGFTYGDTSSNQPRAIGEAGMLRLASNHATAMNLDHAFSWLSVDALWVYNETFGFTQYNNSLCGGGMVDVFRIPKFSYYFYQSQRDTAQLKIPGADVNSGPMVYIANFWTPSSPLSVRVFSNCSQVRLSLNGTVVATKTPDALAHIEHPPFTFTIPAFSAGTLLAEGLINGSVRASHQVKTPGLAKRIQITIDTAKTQLKADGSDLAIVYAAIVDSAGTVVPNASNPVTFSVNGPGTILSGDGNPVTAVAGIATVYVQSKWNNPGTLTITGTVTNLTPGTATVTSNKTSQEILPTVISKAYYHEVNNVPATITQKGSLITIAIPKDSDNKLTPVFTLYNLQGQIVKTWKVSLKQNTLVHLDAIARGVYLGKLWYGKEQKAITVFRMKP